MVALASIAPAAVITIVAIVLIVAAIVVFLLAIIVELKTISNGLDVVIPPVAELVQKTQPVNQLVHQIVSDLGAGTNLLEGLLVKKAGMDDAAGLIESLFPGGGQAFLARNGRPGRPRHFGVVYSRGALQLARLGRGSPLGSALRGSPLRNPLAASEAPRALYPDPRGVGPTGSSAGAPDRPRTPVIGANSPNQYRRPGDTSVVYDSSTDAAASPRAAGAEIATSSYKTGGASRFQYATQNLEPDASAGPPRAPISAATSAPNRFGVGSEPTPGFAVGQVPKASQTGPEAPTEPNTPEPNTPEPASPAGSDDVIHYRR
jgi:hypothetical protein